MKNVGGIDKKLRIIVGAVIVGAGIYFQNYWGAIGLIPLLTGLMNWCPLYSVFGIKTCKTK